MATRVEVIIDENHRTEQSLTGSRWRSVWGRDWRTWVAFGVLFLLLIPVFLSNAAGTAETEVFESWQTDSEALVLAKIESDRVGNPVDSYGLSIARPDRTGPYSTIDQPDAEDSAQGYTAYPGQLGLTGYLYSALYQYTPCSSLQCLHLAASALFSLMLTALVFLLGLITRRSFAVIFLLSVVASPWLVVSARNLYWSPWMWLLPVCAAALFVLATKKWWRVASLALVVLTFAVRFASGYEFITSMSLMAVSVPVLALLFQGDFGRARIMRAVTDAVLVLGASVLAFAGVLLIHASLRGSGSIIDGLGNIWREDVQRRTYGSAGSFDPGYAESLNAGPFSALRKYLFEWQTDFMSIGSGTPFTITFGPLSLWILISLCVFVVALRFAARDGLWLRDLTLLAVTAAIPVSWFVLGKSHSYVHTHINFVLWYLFFAGALFFVLYDYLVTRGPVQRATNYLSSRRESLPSGS